MKASYVLYLPVKIYNLRNKEWNMLEYIDEKWQMTTKASYIPLCVYCFNYAYIKLDAITTIKTM